MAMAVMEISESYGAGPTVQDGITNCNFGSATDYNLVTTDHPITPNTYSYEKYWRYHVNTNSSSHTISNLKVTISDNTDTYFEFKASVESTGYAQQSYSQPVNTVSTPAHNTFPESDTGANLGIGGLLTGTMTSGYSDYMVAQLRVLTGATEGSSVTITFAYDETG